MLALAARLTQADRRPILPYDPDTISTCSAWYDNVDGKTCEEIRGSTPAPPGYREIFKPISPEDFTRWNPSVGLDCGHWQELVSYCVWVEAEGLPPASVTSSVAPTPTTSEVASPIVPTNRPQPTWIDIGCYTDNDLELTTLSRHIAWEEGDVTVSGCQEVCYDFGYKFTGLKAGSECWCGGFVGSELATNATECNIPCVGGSEDMNEPEIVCGGRGAISVYEDSPAEGVQDLPAVDFWQ